MINILYCFDSNYNVQAAVSINSILEKFNNDINIYIVHDNPSSFKKFEEKLKNKKNLNSLNIYRFDNTEYDFPNLNDSHVTYATYFRMFIDNYLPENLDFLVYVDADIICLENPEDELDLIFKELQSNELPLAGLTEGTRTTSTLFETLSLKGERYFNAGMIVIDYQKWLSENTGQKLIDLMKVNYENIKYWDQDVMNMYFDGKYLEIPRSLNYTSSDGINLTNEKIYFLHYAGSKKPWYLGFVFNKISNNYQKAYKNLFKNSYHVTLKFKKHEIPQIINIIKSKDINLINKLKFFYGAIKTTMNHIF